MGPIYHVGVPRTPGPFTHRPPSIVVREPGGHHSFDPGPDYGTEVMIMRRRSWYLVLGAMVIVFALAACGGSSDRGDRALAFSLAEEDGAFGFSEGAVEPAAPPAMPAGGESKMGVDETSTAQVAPFAAPARGASAGPAGSFEGDRVLAVDFLPAPSIQPRMIVRTVDMALIVGDLPKALEDIGNLAEGMNGWVVHSSRQEDHRAFISVRVPAARADEAIDRLRGLATEVESEVSSSRDVTDEFVDNQSRLRNLTATEEQLLKFLEKTAKVEELLMVQQELTKIQGQIEEIQGRIKLLTETSAFSLINVSLNLEPATMETDAGEDRTASTGQPTRFRAEFTPPEGIEDFRYEWDFGDGSGPVVGTRTVPNSDGVTRSTATATHFYEDEKDSPFIVTFEITGTGEAGVAEGEDTLTVVVTRLPHIEVFAGRNGTVDEGESVRFSGSFTRPEAMPEVSFKWEFGDGSSPVSGVLDAGETTARAVHAYANDRPMPFTATLTITGTADTSTITSNDSLQVLVLESPDWSPGDVSGDAVGVLGTVGRGLTSGAIWAGILSPFWVVALVAGAYILIRRRRGSTE